VMRRSLCLLRHGVLCCAVLGAVVCCAGVCRLCPVRPRVPQVQRQ
jgi:hypothetical protein